MDLAAPTTFIVVSLTMLIQCAKERWSHSSNEPTTQSTGGFSLVPLWQPPAHSGAVEILTEGTRLPRKIYHANQDLSRFSQTVLALET